MREKLRIWFEHFQLLKQSNQKNYETESHGNWRMSRKGINCFMRGWYSLVDIVFTQPSCFFDFIASVSINILQAKRTYLLNSTKFALEKSFLARFPRCTAQMNPLRSNAAVLSSSRWSSSAPSPWPWWWLIFRHGSDLLQIHRSGRCVSLVRLKLSPSPSLQNLQNPQTFPFSSLLLFKPSNPPSIPSPSSLVAALRFLLVQLLLWVSLHRPLL